MCTMGAVDSSPKLRGQCWIGPCYNQLVFLLLFWRDQRLRRYLCDWAFSCVIVIRRTRVWDSGIGHTLGSTYLLCTFITTVTFYSTARVFLGFFLWWLTDEGVNNSVNRGVFNQNNDRSHFSRAGVPKRAGRMTLDCTAHPATPHLPGGTACQASAGPGRAWHVTTTAPSRNKAINILSTATTIIFAGAGQ
jgi:hypothetical protein